MTPTQQQKESKMTTIEHKLDKLTTTIGNHIARNGGNNQTIKAQSLADRYHNLKIDAQEAGIWSKWCDDNHCHIEHNEWDLWS